MWCLSREKWGGPEAMAPGAPRSGTQMDAHSGHDPTTGFRALSPFAFGSGESDGMPAGDRTGSSGWLVQHPPPSLPKAPAKPQTDFQIVTLAYLSVPMLRTSHWHRSGQSLTAKHDSRLRSQFQRCSASKNFSEYTEDLQASLEKCRNLCAVYAGRPSGTGTRAM